MKFSVNVEIEQFSSSALQQCSASTIPPHAQYYTRIVAHCENCSPNKSCAITSVSCHKRSYYLYPYRDPCSRRFSILFPSARVRYWRPPAFLSYSAAVARSPVGRFAGDPFSSQSFSCFLFSFCFLLLFLSPSNVLCVFDANNESIGRYLRV